MIYRAIVNEYGEEKALFPNCSGNSAFINCILLKENLKIPFPKWRFNRRRFERRLTKWGVRLIDLTAYSFLNTLIYRVLACLEKYDCICIGTAGMAFDDLYKLNDFLSQIDNKLDSKIICLTFHGDFAITEI